VIAERAVAVVLRCVKGLSEQACRDERAYAEPELVVRESSAGSS
jgi:hypothetical protein